MRFSSEWKKRVQYFTSVPMQLSDITIDLEEYESASSVCWGLINYVHEHEDVVKDIEVLNRIALW